MLLVSLIKQVQVVRPRFGTDGELEVSDPYEVEISKLSYVLSMTAWTQIYCCKDKADNGNC